MSAYLSATRDKPAAFGSVVRLGIEASDWRQRQAALLFLSLQHTPLATSPASQRELVRAVVASTLDANEAVAVSAQQALARLRAQMGDFAAHMRALPPALRASFEQRPLVDGAADALAQTRSRRRHPPPLSIDFNGAT